MRKLSELEGVAVGIIHKRGPCTAYALRKELKSSPSSHWRASAGAIYPLLARLQEEGFISAMEDDDDGRGRKLLAITPSGKKALKAWVGEITDPDLISAVFDPLRSRVFFLGALTKSEQIAFAENASTMLALDLENAKNYLAERPETDDIFERAGSAGGVINAKSRIEFLKQLLADLKKPRV